MDLRTICNPSCSFLPLPPTLLAAVALVYPAWLIEISNDNPFKTSPRKQWLTHGFMGLKLKLAHPFDCFLICLQTVEHPSNFYWYYYQVAASRQIPSHKKKCCHWQKQPHRDIFIRTLKADLVAWNIWSVAFSWTQLTKRTFLIKELLLIFFIHFALVY